MCFEMHFNTSLQRGHAKVCVNYTEGLHLVHIKTIANEGASQGKRNACLGYHVK